jgi:hypothetical protein
LASAEEVHGVAPFPVIADRRLSSVPPIASLRRDAYRGRNDNVETNDVPRLTVPEPKRTVDLDTGAMDLLTGLVFLLAGAAIVKFVVSPSTERVLDTFAAGFMPYRAAAGWPRGVQEEEPVAWNWSDGDRPVPPSSGADVDLARPELVDIDAHDAPPATRVDHRSMMRGMARRP